MTAMPGPSTPSWFVPEFYDLVARREAMPGVENLQTVYVRYKMQPEAQVTQNGWELRLSQQFQEQFAMQESQPNLAMEGPLHSGHAPTNITLRIIEAPAEYAVPVKQDRRLTPDFKVRVEVRYRQRVSFALTLKAYVVTQQEKDSLPEWIPDDMGEPDSPKKKNITELKGTTCITHHFEANMNGGVGLNSYGSVTASMRGGGPGGNQFGHFNHGGPPHSAASRSHMFSEMREQVLHQRQDHLLGGYGFGDHDPEMDGGHMAMDTPMNDATVLSQALNNSLMWGDGSDEHAYMERIINSAAAAGGFGRPGQLGGAMDLDYRMRHLGGGRGGPGGRLDDVYGGGPGQHGLGVQHPQPPQSEGYLVQDFEFTNVEFVKPTRMNKVYMAFACTVLDQDIMFVIYQIPTVGICRAEQRPKACVKLGLAFQDMPTPDQLYSPGSIMSAGDTPQHAATAAKRRFVSGPGSDDSENGGTHRPFPRADYTGGADSHLRIKPDQPPPASLPRSRMQLRDLIAEEYRGTGLSRQLTEKDFQALECQAGFPTDPATEQVNLTQSQWEEFKQQFRAVLQLLKRIAQVWNWEDPCIISGFDMDRGGSVHYLRTEPSGTFICRFSMSQPGCLVLSCKAPHNLQADADGLVHALVQIDDLRERRVDSWIRDFPGATHVLDVYHNKRVDKRRVFASAYTRVRVFDPSATAHHDNGTMDTPSSSMDSRWATPV